VLLAGGKAFNRKFAKDSQRTQRIRQGRKQDPCEPFWFLPLLATLIQNLGMKFSAVLMALVFVACLASPARVHKSSWRSGSKSSVRAADPAYTAALATANRFLHAWQTQDHETGIMMLTDAARQNVSRDRLQEFFSPGPDAAFEIQRGRLLSGQYVFPVVLFGSPEGDVHPRASAVVIRQLGKDDWAVDKLP
jgi:hypothetical protein